MVETATPKGTNNSTNFQGLAHGLTSLRLCHATAPANSYATKATASDYATNAKNCSNL